MAWPRSLLRTTGPGEAYASNNPDRVDIALDRAMRFPPSQTANPMERKPIRSPGMNVESMELAENRSDPLSTFVQVLIAEV